MQTNREIVPLDLLPEALKNREVVPLDMLPDELKAKQPKPLFGREAAVAYKEAAKKIVPLDMLPEELRIGKQDIGYQPKQFIGQDLGAINPQGQPPPSIYQGVEIPTEPVKQIGSESAKQFGKELLGAGEVAAQVASGIPGFIVDAGISVGAGYGTLARGGSLDEAAQNITGMQELVRPFVVYQPKTEEGKKASENLGKALHWLIGKPSEIAGETGQKVISPIAGETAGAIAGAGIQTLSELAGYTALFGTVTMGGKKLAGIKEQIKTRPLTDKDVIDFENFIKDEAARLKGKNLNLDDILEALRGREASKAAYDYITVLPVEERSQLAKSILKGKGIVEPPPIIQPEAVKRGIALSPQEKVTPTIKPTGFDENIKINEITGKQAGDMMAQGKPEVAKHIKEGIDSGKWTPEEMQHIVNNEIMLKVAEAPKGEARQQVREKISKVEPVKQAMEGERRVNLEKREKVDTYIRSLDKTPDELAADERLKAVWEKIRTEKPGEGKDIGQVVGEMRKPTTEKPLTTEAQKAVAEVHLGLTSDTLQKQIDIMENKYTQQGIDVFNVYDASLLKATDLPPNYKPMPEDLAKLYRKRDSLLEKETNEFIDKTIKDSGLLPEDVEKGLASSHIERGAPAHFIQESLNRWGEYSPHGGNNISNIYNSLKGKDMPYLKFNVGGTADKPQLVVESLEGHLLIDKDALNKTEKLYNAVASNIGKDAINLKFKNGELEIQPVKAFEEAEGKMEGVKPAEPKLISVQPIEQKAEIPDIEVTGYTDVNGHWTNIPMKAKEALEINQEMFDITNKRYDEAINSLPKELKTKLKKYLSKADKKGLSEKEAQLEALQRLRKDIEIQRTEIQKQIDEVVAKQPVPAEVLKDYPDLKGEGKVSADTGGYAPSKEYIEGDLPFLEAPEMLELVKEINEGKLPHIVQRIKAMGGRALGAFYSGKGDIKLKADIFQDPDTALKVLSHEIGHLVDWLPQKTMARGNILGRIASLKKYFSHYLGEYKGAEGILTKEDKARLMKEAREEVKVEKETGVEHIEEVKLSADDVKNIWIDVDARTKNKPKGLYDFITSLSRQEKKQILLEAMRDLISDKFQTAFRKSFPLTDRPYKNWEQKIRDIYQILIQKEIEKRRLFKRDEISKELKDLTQKWRPFNPSDDAVFTKYRHSSKELYADAFSVLLNDPKLLREKAPIFEKAFFNWLDQKPEVKEIYDKIIKRTPKEKQAQVEKNIEEMFAKGEEAHRAEIEPPKGMVEHLQEFKGGFKKELIDRFSPLYDSIKDPIARKKAKMAIEDMIYKEAENEAYLISLQKITDSVKDVGEVDLGKYMLLKRAATERKGMANPVVGTGKAAQKYLEGFKNRIGAEKFNKIEELVKNFFNLRKEYVFAELEKAGMLEPKLLELLKNNPNYATFDVIHYITRRAGRDISKQIHEQIGTLQGVANVFTSTVLKDIALMRTAIQTIAKKAAIEAMSKEGIVKPADLKWDGRAKIPVKPIDPDLGLIAYFDNGKVVGFYIPKEIAETFKRNPVEAWKTTQFFRAIANPFREIFVHKRPGFTPFNAIRDFLGTVQTTQGMTITNFLPTWLKSLPDAHRRTIGHYDPEIIELLKGKALIPSVDYVGGEARDITQFERLLVKYRINDAPERNMALRGYDRFVHWLNYLSETSETVTKVATSRWLKEHTDLSEEDIMYLVRWSGSPAFLIKGEATPLTNNILLFSNPMIQGWRWQAESAKAHPKEYAGKYVKYSLLPTMLKYAAYAGFLGATIEKLMKRIGKYDLTNYYIIPLGETPDGKTVYLRIPHNETMRVTSGLLWKGLTDVKDASDIFSLLDYTVNQAPGLSPAISIPMDILSFMAGNNVYDSFRGRMAIPEMIMAAKDNRTKEAIAKYLANKAGVGIVYKFDTSDPVKIKGQLEKILGYPIASDILGRFIKVSDVGTAEHIKEDVVEPIRTATARYKLDVYEAVNALVAGKTPTNKQWLALGIEEQKGELDKKILKTYMRSHGNAWLKAILNAKSEEEKTAIIDTMLKEAKQASP